MRYLAIDHGTKRTGLAICDASETIASPLDIICGSTAQLIKQIVEVIATENVEAIVIGIPLNMDGSMGRQAETVKKFASLLEKNIGLPIYLQDERLSSFAAEEKFAGIPLTPKKRKKKPLDAVAAAHILETFLEQKNADPPKN